MNTVYFGNKNSYSDWGLVLSEKEIGYPEPKTETVDIIGADGVVDLSESLTNDIKFKNRQLSFTFTFLDDPSTWWSSIRRIATYLHGQKLRIKLSEDPSYYFYGRCTINSFKTSKRLAQVVITCDCDPYRQPVSGSGGGVL